MSMAKRSKKLKAERLPPFTPILNEELDSKAFKKLTGNAAKALLYFRRINGILKRKNGDKYDGIFDLTYTEAGKYGFARSTYSKSISSLVSKGFIDIVEHGGKRGCGKSNSKYRLSERWRDYDTKTFIKRPRYPCEP